MATIMAMNIIMIISIIQTNIIMNILMIITPIIYIEDIIMITGIQLSASIGHRFFVEFRLSPYQIREIRILNSRFSSYGHWQRYYRYNPNRWYYDRFIALERILGPRIYVVYYQRYYRKL